MDSHLYFHNWSGGFHNNNAQHNGNWHGVDVYVSSDGYVVIRFNVKNHYFGAVIDYHQFGPQGYPIRNHHVTAEGESSNCGNHF